MEAATPLRSPHVRTIGDRVAVDGLILDDETAVRLVREREEVGEDPARTVTDAVEIGARVLDREQAGANAEYVKTEFERASRQLEQEFAERAGKVAELFGQKVDEVFAPESGRLSKEFERRFSDGSSASVQNQVRELLAQMLTKSREDLVRQFSSADSSNPLAEFKTLTVRALEQAGERQHRDNQALIERVGALDKQLQALRLEKEKLEELGEERERGAAKGRTFEEQVGDAVDAIAAAQGDAAMAVGDVKGATGKSGDVVAEIDACNGPAQGRIVFEAKNKRLSRPEMRKELDRGMRERDADFAVLVVPGEEKLPARVQPLREYDGDKLVVTYDPEEGSTLALEVGYRLARARVSMRRSTVEGVDAGAIREAVDRTLAILDEERRAKSKLSGVQTGIESVREIVEAMAARARAQLQEIDALVRAGRSDEAPEQPSLEL